MSTVDDISEKGLEVLAEEEGVVLRPYRDVAGEPTQGLGHTSRAGAPKVTMSNAPWTREYAFQVARNDIAQNFAPRVRKAMPGAKQHEHDGGVIFDYNTGAIHSASWVQFWNLGNFALAAERIKQWNKAGGKVVVGLVKRRAREWQIIAKGDYGLGKSASPAVMQRGDSGENVRELQRNLIALGYLTKGADIGNFGPLTDEAVRKFQADHPHLTVDGKVGPATRAQVQRALDLRSKAAGVTSTGITASAAAPIADAAQPGAAIDWTGFDANTIAIAVLALTAAAVGVIAWQYRGEIAQVWNKFRS